MRRAQIFTPNLTWRGNDIQHQDPAHFVPMPIAVPSATLTELANMKRGGIIKANNGVKFSDLTPVQQEAFRRLKAEAESSGKNNFEFNGQTYGVSKPLPTTGTPETLPEVLTNGITTFDNAKNNFMTERGITSGTKVELPEFVNVEEEIIDEPSIANDLSANGYSNRLIRQQAR